MARYDPAHEAERKERMTPDHILKVAKIHGMFFVSLRTRDDWLRRRCVKLRQAGALTGGKRRGRGLQYFPVDQ